MFDIEYKGGNTVVISTKKSKLVIDPRLSIIGLKDMPTKDTVVLATEARFAVNETGALLNIEGPGEYEIGDFSIKGIAAQGHMDSIDRGKCSTIYRIEVGDVRIVVIGNIDHSLSEGQLEEIGVIDLAVVPVGGNGYTLDATSAAHLMRAIDAKVVIPVHYADVALKYEVPQDDIEVFKKEFGGEVEQTPKLKVKTVSALPTVQTIIEVTRS
jgi:L-ascorbate metabolism protein UlaG (beta-lactamase superfamily)